MFTMPHKDSPLVAVVGCSAIKTAQAAPARDFYRSPLFKAALAFAELRTNEVRIVSARYGALKLDAEVEPYDMKLSTFRKVDREDWGARTVDDLRRGFKVPPTFVLLCGELYADAILYGAHWHNLPRPQTPMAQMSGVGNRIAWLNAERATVIQERRANENDSNK